MTPTDDKTYDMLMLRMDSQDADLKEIKEHVTKTNGRVTALELWKARLDGIKWIIGGLAAGSAPVILAHFLH